MGNFVVLKHNENTYTIYFHLQHESVPPVKSGDKIKAGTRIGFYGSTGYNPKTPSEANNYNQHLHFCVVDVTVFPTPGFITKPLDSWEFYELNGSNELILNNKYFSQNQ